VLTGYIADAELNLLYNLCDLFVFPSLYEGFGLPVLEAMTCGACVIASGTSSMPEIVGRNDALFEPTDLTGLTRLMKELLAEPERRRELAAFNLARSREFSWDRVAQTMLAAIEETQRRQACALFGTERPKRPRVALFAPLPPQPTPIADYTAAMLPHWARYFDLELIADNYTPDLDSIHGRYPVVDVRELRRDPSRYDCVLYLLANSEFHAEMYELLPEIPGVVLMFDAVLSRLVDWLESTGRQPGILMRALSSEGERALLDLEAAERGDLSVEALVARHPMSRRVLLHACGMILQWQHARRLLCRAYPDLADVPYRVVPPPSFHKAGEDRATARAALGLDAEDVLIASFGVLDETRLNDVLLAAVARDDFVQDPRIRVAFVGELPQGPYRTRIVDVLGQHPMRDRIAITGGVEKFVHERYRVACDIAVQLEALTDASSLAVTHELLATGCATVVSGETIRGEWPDHVVRKLDAIDAATLATALFALIVDRSTRNSLAASARRWIACVCHPALVAARHASAVTLLPELDRARCAASLVRRIAECVANDELESEVSVAASDAIAPGIALHPTTARRLPRQRDSLEPSRTSGKRQA
jgi:glycosyltransferase involved in cell wall biosynthesis